MWLLYFCLCLWNLFMCAERVWRWHHWRCTRRWYNLSDDISEIKVMILLDIGSEVPRNSLDIEKFYTITLCDPGIDARLNCFPITCILSSVELFSRAGLSCIYVCICIYNGKECKMRDTLRYHSIHYGLFMDYRLDVYPFRGCPDTDPLIPTEYLSCQSLYIWIQDGIFGCRKVLLANQ